MVASRNRELPTLPAYDDFNIYLSGAELQKLKVLWREYGAKKISILDYVVPRQFIWRNLLKEVSSSPLSYQFAHWGRIPLGTLPLQEFNELQEPLILEKLLALRLKVELTAESSLFSRITIADERIYSAQYQKILNQTLYYLHVEADGNVLNKIGVSQRSIEERLAEIRRDLRQHFQSVAIAVIGTWQHRGNVEKYFKHRYRRSNYRIGTLTEYFKFDREQFQRVIRDLERMKPKILSEVEQHLINRAL